MKFKRPTTKQLLWIAVTVIVCAIAAYSVLAWYFDWQKQGVETAGWKTYGDPGNRFSIEYPNDWQVLEDPRNDQIIFCSVDDQNCATNAIIISVYTIGGATEILNGWRTQGDKYQETRVSIDNQEAIKRQESLCNSMPLLTNGVFITGKYNDYQIQGPISQCGISVDESAHSTAAGVFDKMLSTFKFTK